MGALTDHLYLEHGLPLISNLWFILISNFKPWLIVFILMSVFQVCMGWAVSYERLPKISVFSSVLSIFTFFQITSDYFIPCFPWSSSGENTTNFGRFYIYQTNYSLPFFLDDPNLLSCKHFTIFFNFSLVLSSPEIISPGLTLYICLRILASFLSSLITSCSWTGQVSPPYKIKLHTHAECNLSYGQTSTG